MGNNITFFDAYRLRNLLKDQPYVALAYAAGILPVKKYVDPTKLDLHSALNMFWEYSMTMEENQQQVGLWKQMRKEGNVAAVVGSRRSVVPDWDAH